MWAKNKSSKKTNGQSKIVKTGNYTSTIHLKVTEDQKIAISEIAKLYDRNISSYLRVYINDQIRKHEV